jgi:F-type H+-transporting ATPase subunit delta
MSLDPHLKEELKKFLLKKIREESEILTVTSAHPLTPAQEAEIKTLIPDGKKEMNTEIDTSLIAGVILKKGSKILDLSLKGRLQNLENQIINQ